MDKEKAAGNYQHDNTGDELWTGNKASFLEYIHENDELYRKGHRCGNSGYRGMSYYNAKLERTQ